MFVTAYVIDKSLYSAYKYTAHGSYI